MTDSRIERLHPDALSDQAPYAYAAVAADVSRLVSTAGACPLDEDGAVVAVGDVAGRDAPSTLLAVAVLGYPGQLVEVEAIAALRSSRG